MEWIKANERHIQLSLNIWFLNPHHDIMNAVPVKPYKYNKDAISNLSSVLFNYSQLDQFKQLSSEIRLLHKIYTQSRYQIRSFPYIRTLKKLKQSIKKMDNLNICDICSAISMTKLSNNEMLTHLSFESLQWRCLAFIETMFMVIDMSEKLIGQLTQEMTTKVFLHFPVLFTSLASSISMICVDMIGKTVELFCHLRTLDHEKIVQLPTSSEEEGYERPLWNDLPWDDSFVVKIKGIPAVAMPAKPSQQYQLKQNKVDFKITSKPNAQLRGRKQVSTQAKQKTSLDSLGF